MVGKYYCGTLHVFIFPVHIYIYLITSHIQTLQLPEDLLLICKIFFGSPRRFQRVKDSPPEFLMVDPDELEQLSFVKGHWYNII